MNQTQPNSRSYSVYYLLTAFLLWIIFYIPFIRFQILHVDEAVYLIVAKQILKGAVPYLDVWDHKPPMVFWLYAFIMKLFGTRNFIPINIVTLLFNLVSTLMVFKITKLFTNRKTAGLTAVIYPILSNFLLCRDAVNPNTEIYMTPFSLCAVYFAVKGLQSGRKISFLLSGLAVGIASAFKQPSGIVLIPLSCGLIVFNFKDKKWKHIFYSITYLWLGCFMVWFFIGLYFFSKNALWEFWFQVFEFNFLYSRSIPKSSIILGVFRNYLPYIKAYPLFFVPYLSSLVFSIVYLFLPRRDFNKKCVLVFILLWHVCDILAVSTGGLFYYHYFVQWVPSLIIVTFVPVTFAFDIIFKKHKTAVKIIGLIYCVLFLIKMFIPAGIARPTDLVIDEYRTPVQYAKYAKSWAKSIGPKFYRFPYYRKPKLVWGQMNLVKMIQSYVKPDQSVFVWGFVPDIYLLVNRNPASRFLYTSFLSGKFHAMANLYNAADSPLKKYKGSINKLLIADLQSARPKFIIVSDNQPNEYSEFFFDYLSDNYKSIDIKTDMPLTLYIINDRATRDRKINNRTR